MIDSTPADHLEVLKVDYGLYLLNDGDTARTVAHKVYADPLKGGLLLNVNGNFTDLERVTCPGKKGRVTEWQKDDTPQRVIRRMFPEQPVSIFIEPFYKWNGGREMHLLEGDVVFIPER